MTAPQQPQSSRRDAQGDGDAAKGAGLPATLAVRLRAVARPLRELRARQGGRLGIRWWSLLQQIATAVSAVARRLRLGPRRPRSPRAQRFWIYGQSRALVLCLLLPLVISRQCAAPVPASTVEGLAEALGAASGGSVATDELLWESSRGELWDALVGRDVLFLARAGSESLRELFRARVRVSREGRLIGVVAAYNLSKTPLGDEAQLTALDGHVAVVVRAFQTVQGVTLLDTRGPAAGQGALVDRWVAALDGWLEVGSSAGIRRTEVVLGRRVGQVAVELREGVLVLAVGRPPQPASVVLTDGHLVAGADNPYRVQAWTIPAPSPRLPSVLRLAWERWLGAPRAAVVIDAVRAARAWLVEPLSAQASSPTPGSESTAAPAGRPLGGGTSSAGWPPVAPALDLDAEAPGDFWRPVEAARLPAAPGSSRQAEPYFLEGEVSTRPGDASSAVHLVAIDTRQLRVGIVPGYDRPRPWTGPRGSGRLPHATPTAAVLRVVAAFNGPPAAGLDGAGMVADGRVLVPPSAGRATLAVNAQGLARMGTWSAGGGLPDWIASLRQGLAPLLADGMPRPTEPASASPSEPPADDGKAQERSALCLTRGGHLLYAWAPQHGVDELADVMARADCQFAMDLAGADGGAGFVYLTDPPRRAVPAMSVDPAQFAVPSPRDFVYLALRDPRPRSPLRSEFVADGGAQPEPPWLPAVLKAERTVLGAEVRLHAFLPGRLSWEIRPGRKERAGWAAEGALAPELADRALVAISLGVGFRKDNRRGLVLDGKVALPIRPDLGVLAISLDGRPLIGLAVEEMAPPGDASELPLLAEGGRIRAEARALGPYRRRAAACLLGDGTFLVAAAEFDSDEATTVALLEAGCRRVVDLNRGAQVGAFVHRAGTDRVVHAEYDATVLYGLARSGRGLARRLDESNARPVP